MEPLQTKYPPLLPAVLAAVFLSNPDFPENAPWLEAAGACLGVACLATAGAALFGTRRATVLMALTAAGATWLNLDFLSYLPVTMADLGSGAFAIAALWLCEWSQRVCAFAERPVLNGSLRDAGKMRALPPPAKTPVPAAGAARSVWLNAGVGLLLGLSTLTHAMGAFTTLAVVIYLAARREVRSALITVATWAVFVAPFWIWSAFHSLSSPPVMVYYTNYLLATRTLAAQGGFVQFALSNLKTTFVETIDITIQLLKWLIVPGKEASPEAVIIYGAIWSLLVLGVAHELKRKGPHKLFALWIVIQAVAHLFWPRGVGLRRLLIVLPFIYYYLFRGARVIALWLKDARRSFLIRQAFIGSPLNYKQFCAISAVGAAILVIAGDLREDILWAGKFAHRVPPPVKAPQDYAESSEFHEAYGWIKKNTGPSEVLVWNNDPAVYLWTGRKAILASVGESFGVFPHAEITPDTILESIRLGPGDYLVIDPVTVGGLIGFEQLGAAVESLIRKHPGLLTHAFTTRWGLITIFKIDRSKI